MALLPRKICLAVADSYWTIVNRTFDEEISLSQTRTAAIGMGGLPQGKILGTHFNLIIENDIVKHHVCFIMVIQITVQLFFLWRYNLM